MQFKCYFMCKNLLIKPLHKSATCTRAVCVSTFICCSWFLMVIWSRSCEPRLSTPLSDDIIHLMGGEMTNKKEKDKGAYSHQGNPLEHIITI